jgi:sugar phosphate isomerase/epimerase
VALGHEPDLAALTGLGCEVVELCGCDSAGWRRVAPRIGTLGVPVGLHCPVPFDGTLRGFGISSPDDRERATAVDLVERTLDAAAHSGAAYVVVHFPSAYRRPPDRSPARPDPRRRDEVLRHGERLALAQHRAGVPVLVENLSYHPDFGSAEDYAEFFTAYPGLRMCLDVGHAQVSRHTDDMYEFVARTAKFVASAHVYNTRRDGTAAGSHTVPLRDQASEDGWIDLRRVLSLLAELSTVDHLVLEYTASRADAAAQYGRAAWLRDVVGDLSWA